VRGQIIKALEGINNGGQVDIGLPMLGISTTLNFGRGLHLSN
jgi:hypothetical protein